MVNSTLEDLILYMYNELTPEEKARIEADIQSNWPLKEKYNVLKEAYERLMKIKLQSPRMQSVEAILSYANKTSKVSS